MEQNTYNTNINRHKIKSAQTLIGTKLNQDKIKSDQ
jgi:hypothetical protein